MEAPLAEPGQRLLARIVDTLVVGLPVVIIVRELVSGHMADVLAPPAVAGCMLLYEATQLALWGRTLGKRFAGIEVVVAPAGALAADGEPSALDETMSANGSTPPGALRSVLRAAIYSLPIAARPIPVLGILGGIFWVANGGMLYEGTRRQAVHDRLAGTLVVKSAPSDSSAL